MPNSSSQAEKAYSILKRKILDQELRQGAPVVESEIAAELAMSRTPVREAIRRLDSDGLLEIIPRKGSYIRTFTITDLIGLYEIAEGLEGMVAFLVAERKMRDELDQDSVRILESLISNMDEHHRSEDYRAWGEADEAYHRHLYFLSGNPFLIDTLVRIRTQLNITLFNTIPSFINLEESNEEHKAILKEILDGNPDRARSINQKQHNRVRNNLMKHNRVVN